MSECVCVCVYVKERVSVKGRGTCTMYVPKLVITQIHVLVDLELAVRYGIAMGIYTCTSKKF